MNTPSASPNVASVPRGWLKQKWVEDYCVVGNEDGTTTLTTNAIDKPDLLQWVRENHLPQIAFSQFRTSLRRLCLGVGSNSMSTPLREDLRVLLAARVNELGQKTWGSNDRTRSAFAASAPAAPAPSPPSPAPTSPAATPAAQTPAVPVVVPAPVPAAPVPVAPVPVAPVPVAPVPVAPVPGSTVPVASVPGAGTSIREDISMNVSPHSPTPSELSSIPDSAAQLQNQQQREHQKKKRKQHRQHQQQHQFGDDFFSLDNLMNQQNKRQDVDSEEDGDFFVLDMLQQNEIPFSVNGGARKKRKKERKKGKKDKHRRKHKSNKKKRHHVPSSVGEMQSCLSEPMQYRVDDSIQDINYNNNTPVNATNCVNNTTTDNINIVMNNVDPNSNTNTTSNINSNNNNNDINNNNNNDNNINNNNDNNNRNSNDNNNSNNMGATRNGINSSINHNHNLNIINNPNNNNSRLDGNPHDFFFAMHPMHPSLSSESHATSMPSMPSLPRHTGRSNALTRRTNISNNNNMNGTLSNNTAPALRYPNPGITSTAISMQTGYMGQATQNNHFDDAWMLNGLNLAENMNNNNHNNNTSASPTNVSDLRAELSESGTLESDPGMSATPESESVTQGSDTSASARTTSTAEAPSNLRKFDRLYIDMTKQCKHVGLLSARMYPALEIHFTSCFTTPALVCFNIFHSDTTVKQRPAVFANNQACRLVGIDQTKMHHDILTKSSVAALCKAAKQAVSEGRQGCLTFVPKLWIMVFDEYGNYSQRLCDFWIPQVLFNDQELPLLFAPHRIVSKLKEPGPFTGMC